jgi:hypothetical protein
MCVAYDSGLSVVFLYMFFLDVCCLHDFLIFVLNAE